MYIWYFWQGNHHTYGHIRCIYTVLANPKYHPKARSTKTNVQQHKRSSNVRQRTTVYIHTTHNGIYTHNTRRYIYTEPYIYKHTTTQTFIQRTATHNGIYTQRCIYTQHTTVYIHNGTYTNVQQHKRSSNVRRHTTDAPSYPKAPA